jgi:hypothetical protein
VLLSIIVLALGCTDRKGSTEKAIAPTSHQVEAILSEDFGLGVRLLMTKDQVSHILGQPYQKRENDMVWEYRFPNKNVSTQEKESLVVIFSKPGYASIFMLDRHQNKGSSAFTLGGKNLWEITPQMLNTIYAASKQSSYDVYFVEINDLDSYQLTPDAYPPVLSQVIKIRFGASLIKGHIDGISISALQKEDTL